MLLCDKRGDHHPIYQVVAEGLMILRLELDHYPDRIKFTVGLCLGNVRLSRQVESIYRGQI